MIGAVVCCAASIAGDNLQDLKAGHMIGASPWRQQVMLGVGAVASALVMAPVLNLLLQGVRHGSRDSRASAVAAGGAGHAHGVRFARHVRRPAAVEHGDHRHGAIGVLSSSRSRDPEEAGKTGVRTPVLAAAVGIYLPLELEVPIFVGGAARLASRSAGWLRASGGVRPSKEDVERLTRRGMLFAAGLITGESLMGVLIAIGIVASGRDDVLALPAGLQFGGWVGFLALVALAAS